MNIREVFAHAYDLRDVRRDWCLVHKCHHKHHATPIATDELEVVDAIELLSEGVRA